MIKENSVFLFSWIFLPLWLKFLIKYLIQLFDYSKQHIICEEANGITDSMRQAVKQLVERMMPSLPQKSQEELVGDLHKLEPPKSKERNNSFDAYIDKLLEVTSENSKNQVLFNRVSVKIEFICYCSLNIIPKKHRRCVANFFEIVKGFGMLPDKEIVDFALRVPRCIACQV